MLRTLVHARFIPIAFAVVAPLAAQEESAAGRSVMDGVYTMEQADQGEAAFVEECALCHAPSDFQNEAFDSLWAGRPAAHLYSFMQDSLAHDEVADLDDEGYAALLAYVFRLNGFPAAGTPLPADEEELAAIRMTEPTGEPAVVLAFEAPAAEAALTLADGIYTSEQAGRGETVFTEVCSACHGPVEFQNEDFHRAWDRRTVGSLYAFISQNMPDDAPGSLEPGQYADVLAYILQLNGAPAGVRALPAEREALASIPLAPGAAGAAVTGAETAAAPTALRATPGEVRTVMLGVYTEEQAARGQASWEATCAECHETTDFHDSGFVRHWDGKLASELFEFISTKMPDDDPGSLPAREYADIMAYILSLNGAPPAGLQLPPDPAVLEQLRLELGGEEGGAGRR